MFNKLKKLQILMKNKYEKVTFSSCQCDKKNILWAKFQLGLKIK